MAKITIEIDTHDDLDDRDNALLAVLGQHMMVRKAETALAPLQTAAAPQTPAPEPAPAAKGRKTKAAAETSSSALFAPSEAPSSVGNGAEVSLAMINNLLVQLLQPGSGHNADELTQIVKEVTNDEAVSPKHCDPKYWPEIHARFTALAAAG